MILQEMVVTNAQGKTETPEDGDLTGQCAEGEDIYTFYAIKSVNQSSSTPTSEQMAAKVKIMMPLGGELNGMYRFPRIGEKVVVAVEGSSHYLMGYLPTAEKPFSPKEDGKEKTDVYEKKGQVLRYKKTGDNTSASSYSEIGFYSEETEWKKKSDDETLPVVDKIKVSSTGDIETRAQNYNETAAKRIALFAGYGDDIEKRKEKLKKNLNARKIKNDQLRAEGKDPDKEDKDPLDLEAFPVLPQDYADQDPAFFSGDIHMRAKKRIVLKAEDTIEIIAGNSMIRMDSTGISLISRKSSVSAVNPWDSAITVSSRDGLSMFGSKVGINSAYKFSLSDAFGSSISTLGGIMRISAADLSLKTMCQAAYVLKGVSASASFTTNVASSIQGIVQEAKGGTREGGLENSLPSYFSTGAGVAGTIVGANWKLNSMAAINDSAGGMMVTADFIITMLGLVNMVLDKMILSKTDKKNGGRAGLTLATMVVEYGVILTMFIKMNTVKGLLPFYASSYLMSLGGTVSEDAMKFSQNVSATQQTKTPIAGTAICEVEGLWRSFSAQSWWKMLLETVGVLGVAAGIGVGVKFGYNHSSSVNENTRKELEAL